MKSQAPPHQTLNFALRSKKTSLECFYAVYVAQAQKLLRVKSKIIVYQRKLFWKFAVERV